MPAVSPGHVYLNGDWRVRPLDHLQWVLERRTVLGGGRWKGQARQLEHAKEVRERWLPYAYCRTRAGLETTLSRLRSEGIVLDPAPWPPSRCFSLNPSSPRMRTWSPPLCRRLPNDTQ